MKRSVALSLVSHTNAGKTTLARTLLRRDVGEVGDRAHVTDVADAWTLLETEEVDILLWDTPGFGNSVRLLARMRRQDDAVGWFLHQVWDRLSDRPLYCSQEAAKNVREHADAVLYVVDAALSPSEAGFVSVELQILELLRTPVLLVLNQADADDALAESWRAVAAEHPCVRDVVSLDAHRRCHLQEAVLMARLPPLLLGTARADLQAAADLWTHRTRNTFDRSMERVQGWLTAAKADSETQGDGDGRNPAMKRLHTRLVDRTRELMAELLQLHGLDGKAVGEIEAALSDVSGGRAAPQSHGIWAVLGGFASGVVSGLAADVVAGGLTLGGGMLVGGIIGAVGAAGGTEVYNRVASARSGTLSWNREFLAELLLEGALRYLAVAHHGRGRGDFRQEGVAEHWRIELAGATGEDPDSDVRQAVVRALRSRYPEAVAVVVDGAAAGAVHGDGPAPHG